MKNTCTPTGLTVLKQQAPPIDLYSIPLLEFIKMDEDGVMFYADSTPHGFYITKRAKDCWMRRGGSDLGISYPDMGTAISDCNNIHTETLSKYLKIEQP